MEKSERQACFQEKVNQHIRKHVRYPRVEQELRIEGKVYVTFRIQTDGIISHIQLKGPSPGLEAEAQRLISLLPVNDPRLKTGASGTGAVQYPDYLRSLLWRVGKAGIEDFPESFRVNKATTMHLVIFSS